MEIKIDEILINRLKEFQKETSFKNFEELIEFILNDYLNKSQVEKDETNLSRDKQKLNDRLRNLGYL